MRASAKNPWIQPLILLTAILTLSLPLSPAWAYSGGPPDGVCGDPPAYANCTQCHTSFPVNSGDGLLQLLGLPPAYVPDSVYTLTISLQDVGQLRWGFEITSILNSGLQGGTLAPSDTRYMQLSEGAGTLRDYLKHTSAGTFEGTPDSNSWAIQWTAPPPNSDTVHFYLAGNAANANGTNQGDYIYTISVHWPEQILAVNDPPASLPVTPFVLDAYPNPFNPQVTLQLAGAPAHGSVKIELFNELGMLLGRFDIASQTQQVVRLPLDMEDLPSGRYWVRALSGGSNAQTLLIKAK